MPLASAGNTAMLFTAPDRPQRAAQLPEAKHGEPRLPLLRGARAESASSAGAAAQSSGSSSRNFAHLEEHVPPHDRVVFSEGYSPRVGLRVLLEGVEVARARLAEQLDLEALRLAEQRRQRSAGSRAKSGRSRADGAERRSRAPGTRLAVSLDPSADLLAEHTGGREGLQPAHLRALYRPSWPRFKRFGPPQRLAHAGANLGT